MHLLRQQPCANLLGTGRQVAARPLVQTKPRNPAPAPSFQGHSRSQGRVFFFLFFFLTPKTFCFGLQLINNVVIVPVKRLSHIYTCIHSPPNPREGLLNGGELGALRTAWIWADFILIGFSPRNKIDNAKQRENGKTRKISDAEQALSRPGISRFVSGKGQIVNIFGSLKTATATKKVNGHGCVSVKLNLQKTGGGLYLAPGQSPHAGPRVTLSAGTLGSLSCVIHLLTALAWVPLCRCEGSIPAWLLTARAGEAGLSRSYPPSHHPPPPPTGTAVAHGNPGALPPPSGAMPGILALRVLPSPLLHIQADGCTCPDQELPDKSVSAKPVFQIRRPSP